MSKLASLKHLIEYHGLHHDDADMLIKEAKPRVTKSYYIKYSDFAPMSPSFSEPTMGNERGIRTQVQYPQQEMQNLSPGMGGNRDAYNPDPYLDENSKGQAVEAASHGQKEVLDTSVISGLVKSMDTAGLVDGYIGDLLLGLDRIGRILFVFYWHNDKFKERYGQQDLADLEDNLRNVFKNLGELTLFLKQKTVEPDINSSPEAEISSVMV